MNNPDRKSNRIGEPGEVMVSATMAAGIAIAAVIVFAMFYFWPADEIGKSTSTDTSTRVEQAPITPPAKPSAPNQ
jgi:hypothetical protein